jgi:membrane protein DedA with SNARE-associated domain
MPEPEVATTDEERRARRKRLTILLTPVVFFWVTGLVTNWLSPALIKHHPLVVIFFNPINRYLILAANRVETWEFFAVSFIRLVLTDPIYFLLGRWFGDGALDWIENKTGNSGAVPFIKKWFGRAGPLFVFLAPNAYVCLLAGAAGMNIALFVGLNATGTIGRLILIKATGDVFEPVLRPVVNFLDRYRWQFVALSIALFALQAVTNRKKGKTGEVESVGKMADELEASIEARETD